MKKFLLLLLTAMAGQVTAQPFTLLANDPQGDPTSSFVADAAALYYRLDVAQDSIWFRVETHTPVDPHGDVGLMFGLDTNMNILDGISWQGSNNAMKYDLALLVYQNIIFPTYFGSLYSAAGSASIPVVVLRPDSFTFIISVQLSMLDSDQNFNLLFGTGAFDIAATRSVFDDVPNTGYLTVPSATGIVEPELSTLSAWPNPAISDLHLRWEQSFEKPVLAILYDATGRTVMEKTLTSNSQTLDISGVRPGVYSITVLVGDKKILKRIVVH